MFERERDEPMVLGVLDPFGDLPGDVGPFGFCTERTPSEFTGGAQDPDLTGFDVPGKPAGGPTIQHRLDVPGVLDLIDIGVQVAGLVPGGDVSLQ